MRANEIYRRTDVKPVEPLIGKEHSGIREQEHAEIASRQLRDATLKLFRKWERINGFQEGAAELLLPAGYVPVRDAA